jgi:hypothetical protein
MSSMAWTRPSSIQILIGLSHSLPRPLAWSRAMILRSQTRRALGDCLSIPRGAGQVAHADARMDGDVHPVDGQCDPIIRSRRPVRITRRSVVKPFSSQSPDPG